MFEYLTHHARHVIVWSQDEARGRGHASIRPEHLLLGILHEPESVAARTLTSTGNALDAVLAALNEMIPNGPDNLVGEIPFEPETKTVLENAVREAIDLGDGHIGTEHLLLSLLRNDQSIAYRALTSLGAEAAAVRRRAVIVRADHPESPGRDAEPKPSRVDTTATEPISTEETPLDIPQPSPHLLNDLGQPVTPYEAALTILKLAADSRRIPTTT